MENNDSNIKSQQTGGLKLMTVFIAVLALHVLVIGGFTVYHLMSGGSTDADLLADKTHKTPKVASDNTAANDASSTETAQADKTPANAAASTEESTASADNNSTPAPAPAVANTSAQPSGPVVSPPPVSTPAPAPTTTASAEQAPAPAFGLASSVNGTPYVVKAHDSLARIAHQNHTSVAKLKAANSLTTDMLHVGQKLIIPARTQVAAATAPAANPDASGSTTILSSSASTPSMSVPAATPTTAAVKTVHEQTPAASVATGGHHVYTVMKGDTLVKIARKFKTTPTAIMTANNITDPAKLSIGKKLKIPTAEARSAATETPAADQSAPAAQSKPVASGQLANYLQ